MCQRNTFKNNVMLEQEYVDMGRDWKIQNTDEYSF